MADKRKPDVMGCEGPLMELQALSRGIIAITECPHEIGDDLRSNIAQLALMAQCQIENVTRLLCLDLGEEAEARKEAGNEQTR